MAKGNNYYGGVSFGTLMAAIISYSVNHSLGWAVVHGLFSWFYIIYWAVFQ